MEEGAVKGMEVTVSAKLRRYYGFPWMTDSEGKEKESGGVRGREATAGFSVIHTSSLEISMARRSGGASDEAWKTLPRREEGLG